MSVNPTTNFYPFPLFQLSQIIKLVFKNPLIQELVACKNLTFSESFTKSIIFRIIAFLESSLVIPFRKVDYNYF